MSLLSGKILEIPITFSSKEKILEEVKKYLKNREENKKKKANIVFKPFVIVTPNPEQIMLARQNARFARILKRADVALPDGIGVVVASHFSQRATGNSIQAIVQERIPGIEFMQDLLSLAVKERVTIGLIGGRDGVAVKALECLREANPGLDGWAIEPEALWRGEMKEVREIGEKIRKTHTGIVFVGLGAPKQEYYIEALRRLMTEDSVIFMSVGGSFDILSGKIQRAPVFIRNVGMEWLWRLGKEPWRWKRQLALIQFALLVLQERYFCTVRQAERRRDEK